MKFLLLACLFYVFCHVSGQRSLLYSLLGKFYVQFQPSTTIYSCSRSEICCAFACTRNDLCAFFSFSRDDHICMLYDQSWTANLTTVYNSSWSTYKTENRREPAAVSTQPPGCVIDQTTNGSCWTVIQRRQDGSVDFFRNWTEYERGFGNPESEYWIGLANLHNLTSRKNVTLRVDLTDFDGSTAYAVYDNFSITDAQDNYRLNVGGYSGTAGDSLAIHNTMQFSTFDRDHSSNCAQDYHGAWWYRSCHYSNLNGRYKTNGASGSDGVNWYYWKSDFRSLKRVEMKIKQQTLNYNTPSKGYMKDVILSIKVF